MTIQTLPVNFSCVNIEIPTNEPKYATDGSGAFDISASEDAVLTYGSPAVIKTNLKFEIPSGHAMFIYSRSGHGFNKDTRLANCVGVIDSDYRGELMIKLSMDVGSWQQSMEIKKGDRIAQGVIIPVPKVVFVKSETLSSTKRGENGFGSTGVQ